MYPDVVGGAEIFICGLAKSLLKIGHEVHIVARVGPQFRTGFYDGIFFHSYADVNFQSLKLLTRNLQICSKLLQIKPDICLGVMLESALACGAYSRFLSKPGLVRFAGHDFKQLFSSSKDKIGSAGVPSFLQRFLYLTIFTSVKQTLPFIVINKEMVDGLSTLGVKKTKLHLIYNFVADSFFDISPKSAKPVVVFCGRLIPEKGVDVLVKAFAHVVKCVPNATLILVGDGNYRSYIEDLIKSLNISNNVEITGLVSNDKIRFYLTCASIFVLPSRSEALGNALLEAMAAGLPVIGTCVGGIPDLIDNDVNGLLVKPNDVTSLSNAIIFLLANTEKAKEFGKNSRKKASLFKVENIVTQYVDVLNSIMPSKKS